MGGGSNLTALSLITGCTGGIGAPLAAEMARLGHDLMLFARDKGALKKLSGSLSENPQTQILEILADLAAASSVSECCQLIEREPAVREAQTVILYNNASRIDPIVRLEDLAISDIDAVLRVNLGAPFALAAAVIRARRQKISGDTIIVNISSGVGVSPVVGWSVYGVTKAGLNMLAKSIALESEGLQHRVRAISINPGATDTGMQRSIRLADPNLFPSASKFGQMFTSGQLKTPAAVASRIVEVVLGSAFESGSFVDFNKG